MTYLEALVVEVQGHGPKAWKAVWRFYLVCYVGISLFWLVTAPKELDVGAFFLIGFWAFTATSSTIGFVALPFVGWVLWEAAKRQVASNKTPG